MDIVALPFPLSKERPADGGIFDILCPLFLYPVIFFTSGFGSSKSTARPLPLSSLGPNGDDSPLLLRAISTLTLLGNEILFVPVELPLLSTCKLALVEVECRFCLCSGNVNNG